MPHRLNPRPLSTVHHVALATNSGTEGKAHPLLIAQGVVSPTEPRRLGHVFGYYRAGSEASLVFDLHPRINRCSVLQ
eukprot:scaffold21639_cov51-Cyclotella_meneghiniana.AAC.2